MSDLNNRIQEMINSNDVFLFMKGEQEQPMCRFSAQVVSIMNQYNKELIKSIGINPTDNTILFYFARERI